MNNVTIKMPTIQARGNWLTGDINKAIGAAATDVTTHLKINWTQGRGGDEVNMKPLSNKPRNGQPGYADQKKASGRNPIPDLLWSGELHKSMLAGIRRPNKFTATIGFSGAGGLEKARSNYALRPNMMELSDKFKNQVIKNVYNDMRSSK